MSSHELPPILSPKDALNHIKDRATNVLNALNILTGDIDDYIANFQSPPTEHLIYEELLEFQVSLEKFINEE